MDTVEALTGVKINKIAELNLIGFYELANEFGGAEVCVKPWPGGDGFATDENLSDPNSGVVLKPGYQLLSPEQTLAFVRARDSLPEGDLDRTARQQAILDYVLWKLKTEGSAHRRRQARPAADRRQAVPGHQQRLEPSGVRRRDGRPERPEPHLPHAADHRERGHSRDRQREHRQRRQHPGDGAAGLRDPARDQHQQPRQQAAAARRPTRRRLPRRRLPRKAAAPVLPASSVTVDAYNSSQTPNLAATLSQALVAKGYKAGTPGVPHPATTDHGHLRCGSGWQRGPDRQVLRRDATASSSVAAGHVQVILSGSATGPAGGPGRPGRDPLGNPVGVRPRPRPRPGPVDHHRERELHHRHAERQVRHPLRVLISPAGIYRARRTPRYAL